ncbi:MAG: LLM class flavin-dependent oxidoreductase [Dermatophilaceae bacterium]
MEYSILVPFVPARIESVLPFAALAAATPGLRLWQGQSLAIEGHHMFASLATHGYRVPTGLGVSLMPMRHPFQAAVETRSLALATGRSVIAGFGPGARSLQKALLGQPYRSPLTASREYLTIVRALLNGLPVDYPGENFRMHGQLAKCPAPPVQLGLGVLRSGMAQLAGELADVAVTWLTPPAYIRDVLRPAMQRGAAQGIRSQVCRVTAMVPVALAGHERDPVLLAVASSGNHLRGPHYQAMLRAAGVAVTGRDVAVDAKALLAANAFVYGDRDDIAAGLAEYAAAGVDEVCLNLVGTASTHGSASALADLTTLLAYFQGESR